MRGRDLAFYALYLGCIPIGGLTADFIFELAGAGQSMLRTIVVLISGLGLGGVVALTWYNWYLDRERKNRRRKY